MSKALCVYRNLNTYIDHECCRPYNNYYIHYITSTVCIFFFKHFKSHLYCDYFSQRARHCFQYNITEKHIKCTKLEMTRPVVEIFCSIMRQWGEKGATTTIIRFQFVSGGMNCFPTIQYLKLVYSTKNKYTLFIIKYI